MSYKLASGRLVRRKLGCYKSGGEDSPKNNLQATLGSFSLPGVD